MRKRLIIGLAAALAGLGATPAIAAPTNPEELIQPVRDSSPVWYNYHGEPPEPHELPEFIEYVSKYPLCATVYWTITDERGSVYVCTP